MKNIKECLRLQGKGANFENLPRGGPPDVPSNMNKKRFILKNIECQCILYICKVYEIQMYFKHFVFYLFIYLGSG